jgi:hypothetical protein
MSAPILATSASPTGHRGSCSCLPSATFPLPTMSDRPLPAPRPVAPAPSIERELQSAARYAASALAPATRRSYERDWRVFAEWCVACGLQPMPAAPEAVAAFLAAEADREFLPVTIG